LKTLNLRNNLLEKIDDDLFAELENLDKLDLSSNNLAILSDLVFRKNLKLEIISLASNYISRIHPKAFQNLRDLKFLDLRGNLCVNEVFEEIWDPEDIKNKLRDCFSKYPANTVFCHFKYKEVGYTCILKKFELEENDEIFIYGDHDAGKNDFDVAGVVFEYSRVTAIPGEVFQTFRNMREINVEFTELHYLRPLKDCGKLEKLKASHNNIERIDHRTFANCSELQFIDLSYNKIQKLLASSFSANRKIQEIDLSHNLIKKIESCELFQDFEELLLIRLSKNLCIDTILHIKDTDLKKVKEKLSFCHASWILEKIII
jgi:Leucine-rich repeat (LRR) protein